MYYNKHIMIIALMGDNMLLGNNIGNFKGLLIFYECHLKKVVSCFFLFQMRNIATYVMNEGEKNLMKLRKSYQLIKKM